MTAQLCTAAWTNDVKQVKELLAQLTPAQVNANNVRGDTDRSWAFGSPF